METRAAEDNLGHVRSIAHSGPFRSNADRNPGSEKGTVKDVQGVMRHSRTAITTDGYMQEIPASVQSTINSINKELRGSTAKSWKKSEQTGGMVVGRCKSVQRVTPNDTNDQERG